MRASDVRRDLGGPQGTHDSGFVRFTHDAEEYVVVAQNLAPASISCSQMTTLQCWAQVGAP